MTRVDIAGAIKSLELFNEKAERLAGSRFLQTVLQQGSGFTWSWQQGAASTAARFGPDREAIEALVLTYRFFIQDNESSSLRNMAKRYSTLPLDPALIQQFHEGRNEVNGLLDAPMPMGAVIHGQSLTRREVWDTFIYGNLAHAKPEKRARYELWKSIPELFSMLEHELVLTLASTTTVIIRLREVNVAALQQLRQQQS